MAYRRRLVRARGGLPMLAAAAGRKLAPAVARMLFGRRRIKKATELITRPLGRIVLPGLGAGAAAAGARRAGRAFSQARDEEGPKRRRINPTNPKALRRAIKRLKSFRKLARKLEAALPKAKPRGKKGRR